MFFQEKDMTSCSKLVNLSLATGFRWKLLETVKRSRSSNWLCWSTKELLTSHPLSRLLTMLDCPLEWLVRYNSLVWHSWFPLLSNLLSPVCFQVLNPLNADCSGNASHICVDQLQNAAPVDPGIIQDEPDLKFYLPFGFFVYDMEHLFQDNSYESFIGEKIFVKCIKMPTCCLFDISLQYLQLDSIWRATWTISHSCLLLCRLSPSQRTFFQDKSAMRLHALQTVGWSVRVHKCWTSHWIPSLSCSW